MNEAIDLASKATGKPVKDITIACMGITFKADIDDLRESPALEIAKKIELLGGKTWVCEPNVEHQTILQHLPRSIIKSTEDCLLCADVICTLVAHKEFKSINHSIENGKYLIDACGLTQGDKLK